MAFTIETCPPCPDSGWDVYDIRSTAIVFCKYKMLSFAAKNAKASCQQSFRYNGIRSIACLKRKLSPVNERICA